MSDRLIRLRQLIANHYSLEEFRTLCFDLGVRYDDLEGGGISAKSRELILYLGRQQQFQGLLEALRQQRPDAFEQAELPINPKEIATFYTDLPISRDALDTDSKKANGDDFSGRDLIQTCQKQVRAVLDHLGQKYLAERYVHRAIEDELHDFFDSPATSAANCYVLVAPAGSGKTNLLCELARQRVENQPVVLLLGGSISAEHLRDKGLLGTMAHELSFLSNIDLDSAGDWVQALNDLSEEDDTNALIMIDAINEHEDPRAMSKALEELLRRTKRTRYKLLITCRDYYWGLFENQPYWRKATVNPLPRRSSKQEDTDSEEASFDLFTPEEFDKALPLYLNHYEIAGFPVGNALEQCRHPLLLRFFCEAYRGQDIGQINDIRLKELFDRYWDEKRYSIANRIFSQVDAELNFPEDLADQVGDYLLNIAAYMLENNVRAVRLENIKEASRFPDDNVRSPHSLFGRIRDEFIILEEKELGRGIAKSTQVSFVYEEFMEYVMALALIRDWENASLDEAKILNEVERLTGKYDSFAQIIGVMVYLTLMLKDELPLWSLLFERGEKWQDVVFEAFRKLPPHDLDTSVFEALEEILYEHERDVEMKVLDLLKIERIGKAAPEFMVSAVLDFAENGSVAAVRRRAALALGYMNPELTVGKLIELTKAFDSLNVQPNFVSSLGRAGTQVESPQLRKKVIATLSDSLTVRPDVQKAGKINVNAAKALGEMAATEKDEKQQLRIIKLLTNAAQGAYDLEPYHWDERKQDYRYKTRYSIRDEAKKALRLINTAPALKALEEVED